MQLSISLIVSAKPYGYRTEVTENTRAQFDKKQRIWKPGDFDSAAQNSTVTLLDFALVSRTRGNAKSAGEREFPTNEKITNSFGADVERTALQF